MRPSIHLAVGIRDAFFRADVADGAHIAVAQRTIPGRFRGCQKTVAVIVRKRLRRCILGIRYRADIPDGVVRVRQILKHCRALEGVNTIQAEHRAIVRLRCGRAVTVNDRQRLAVVDLPLTSQIAKSPECLSLEIWHTYFRKGQQSRGDALYRRGITSIDA